MTCRRLLSTALILVLTLVPPACISDGGRKAEAAPPVLLIAAAEVRATTVLTDAPDDAEWLYYTGYTYDGWWAAMTDYCTSGGIGAKSQPPPEPPPGFVPPPGAIDPGALWWEITNWILNNTVPILPAMPWPMQGGDS